MTSLWPNAKLPSKIFDNLAILEVETFKLKVETEHQKIKSPAVLKINLNPTYVVDGTKLTTENSFKTQLMESYKYSKQCMYVRNVNSKTNSYTSIECEPWFRSTFLFKVLRRIEYQPRLTRGNENSRLVLDQPA